jgi:hypothetical protein
MTQMINSWASNAGNESVKHELARALGLLGQRRQIKAALPLNDL